MKINYNILLVNFILIAIGVVRGQIQTPVRTLPVTTTIINTKTLSTFTTTTTNSPTFTSILDIPVSDLAKKHCTGYRNVEIQYDNESGDFVCHLYDEYNVNSCQNFYVNSSIITTFNDECFESAKIADGVYRTYIRNYTDECDNKTKNMVSYHIIDPSIPLHEKRSLPSDVGESLEEINSSILHEKRDTVPRTEVGYLEDVPINESIKDLVQKYCKRYDVTDLIFKDSNFICYQNRIDYPHVNCSPQPPDTTVYFSTYNDECLNGDEVEGGLYVISIEKIRNCHFGFVIQDWSYYVIYYNPSKYNMYFPPRNTTTTVTTTTKTIPPILDSTIITTETSTKTIPPILDTTTKCLPITVTVTQKEKVTITQKETVTVTVY